MPTIGNTFLSGLYGIHDKGAFLKDLRTKVTSTREAGLIPLTPKNRTGTVIASNANSSPPATPGSPTNTHRQTTTTTTNTPTHNTSENINIGSRSPSTTVTNASTTANNAPDLNKLSFITGDQE